MIRVADFKIRFLHSAGSCQKTRHLFFSPRVTEFHRIAVLGPGVLGGSLALAVRNRHPDREVTLWGRSEEKVAAIRDSGFSKATTSLEDALREAELIVLAVPVGAMVSLAARIPELAPNALVTDVGSVKMYPHSSVGAQLATQGVPFIGSHPMAGSEQSGFQAAREDLFEGACCILTNEQGVSTEKVEQLAQFWESQGARTARMGAADHDRLVARISHLPHMLAVVCAEVALAKIEDGSFAGPGLRDTSRVAAGEAGMWAEILMENREAVVPSLRESIRLLEEYAELIAEGRQEELRKRLEEVRSQRRQLPGREVCDE